uniref:PH domain-containing protein n=1 Tax=Strigamia maritima TaxID=126957 RepID=T1ISD9_STRMM
MFIQRWPSIDQNCKPRAIHMSLWMDAKIDVLASSTDQYQHDKSRLPSQTTCNLMDEHSAELYGFLDLTLIGTETQQQPYATFNKMTGKIELSFSPCEPWNTYCAVCNGINYDKTIHLDLRKCNDSEDCLYVPEPDKSKFQPRICVYDFGNCSVDFSSPIFQDIVAKCKSYAAMVVGQKLNKTLRYKNPHCAICNNASNIICPQYRWMINDFEPVESQKGIHGPHEWAVKLYGKHNKTPPIDEFQVKLVTTKSQFKAEIPPSVSVLFNFGLNGKKNFYFSSNQGQQGRNNNCPNHNIWDPFLDLCRSLSCTAHFSLIDYQCVETDNNSTERDALTDLIFGINLNKVIVCLAFQVKSFSSGFTNQENKNVIEGLMKSLPKTLASTLGINTNRISNMVLINTTKKARQTVCKRNVNIEDYENACAPLLTAFDFNFKYSKNVAIRFELSEPDEHFEKFEPSIDRIISLLITNVNLNTMSLLLEGFTLRLLGVHEETVVDGDEIENWCIDGEKATYMNHEFTIVNSSIINDDWKMNIRINETGKVYNKGEYLANFISIGKSGENDLTSVNGIVVVCENRSKLISHFCPRIKLEESEYTFILNGSVNYTGELFIGKTMLDFGEYEIGPNGSLLICYNVSGLVVPFDTVQAYLGLVLMTVSLFAMAITLYTYFLFPKLRNLPGMNLMNLKFYLKFYMAYAYLCPAVFVSIPIAIDTCKCTGKFAVGYGDDLCWINESEANILFFALPIAILLTLWEQNDGWTSSGLAIDTYIYGLATDHARIVQPAGDLFSVDDRHIVNDLSNVVTKIQAITGASNYLRCNNDQSVVEICITRVTSAIRETGSIQQHAPSLVNLLQSCLNHDLKPSAKDEDPPHAKIAADIISCIFLNYTKKDVMKLAVPVTVKFLHKGNKDLSRNVSSYLSLAAIDNAELLAPHIQPIIDSIISGNYSLSRVLPQIYAVTKEPIHDHVMALVSLLQFCENPEKLSLLSLFVLIAKNVPLLLEPSLPQLCECLSISATSISTLQIFIDMSAVKGQPFIEHIPKMKYIVEQQPNTLNLVAKIIGAVGKLNQEKASDCLDYLVKQLNEAEHATLPILLKEIKSICDFYPVLSDDQLLEISKHWESCSSAGRLYIQQIQQEFAAMRIPQRMNQSLSGVTIVRVGGSKQDLVIPNPIVPPQFRNIGSRQNLGSSSANMNRSMAQINSSSTVNRSMSKLGGSVSMNMSASQLGSAVGIHKSMSRLGSSQGINRSITTIGSRYNLHNATRITCGGVTVTTISPNKSISASISVFQEEPNDSITSTSSHTEKPESFGSVHSNNALLQSRLSTSVTTSINQTSVSTQALVPSAIVATSPSPLPSSTFPPYSGNSILSNNNNNIITIGNPISSNFQRMSVFEPYPMRDAVQHFCEKHLDKIKAYMQKIFVKLPLPVKCTIEERKSKKHAKLHFACQGRGTHCLYNRTFFMMKTRNPRIWIHLMFLALQARSSNALSTREQSVSSLKTCWDILKADNRNFLTLVTSVFPSAKDQEWLISELRDERFFDVFEYNGPLTQWGCFLCNHPDRAVGFLQDREPVIEGQLKEKKGKWKLFKRWRTRYFTLSAAHLSYRSPSDKETHPIDISQIRSVKAINSRGPRSIPKAFEIFTTDKTYVLKAKDSKNAEQWVQCLSIAVAHSHARDTHH